MSRARPVVGAAGCRSGQRSTPPGAPRMRPYSRGRALDFDPHDVRLTDAGLEPDVVRADPPHEALVGQQVVSGEAGRKTEVGGDDRKALLDLMGVDVDYSDNRVAAGVLGVADQRVVGGVEEGYVG